ncbi:bifunctional phosphopantothenoylcysteine decarboxylase/phosphopantothenate--cysteine ligase CoaBC [Arsenicicoccus sp. oral taxon 190]|uniref:bifunctional phosphopantothenoylcysteine decarboxylase/phosphopantothenate--cysteine ligase CoaBC n=1 Tax=Arsenicicoccus sp. oral taxon 190 TaxID=1658671 RepID=UPI000679F493|nr:bifunctional phosphopantothenoylcysteine decarboxylase/phosphopantothenate--cysteine ligase CoaBC [Arsenicicoccus sp. oral taxon 190]AKT51721.1 phosphopantothenoylcysteine decarboxylase [Arsenicicoccus sp. oral taxon 190]
MADQPAIARPRRVVLGVGGGIAAYKAASLLRRFTEAGDDVTVVPTEAALRFVGAPTWSALSGKAVTHEVFDGVEQVRHVALGQQADLVVVAPCTANLLAKAAHGLADDLLTNVLLTARCPVVLAPAMHTEMWQHPATVANVATLRARGVTVIDPASGRLTGADSGPGRLPEPEDIHAAALAALADPTSRPAEDLDLDGLVVVVTAGGTREPLDPVRYLGNRSSGKQGIAIAEAAAARGARVVLVAGAVDIPLPQHPRIETRRIESALGLQGEVEELRARADVVVMAAAVADFRPRSVATAKIKKTHAEDGRDDDSAPTIELVRNPDILAGLVRERARAGAERPYIVGFAAETGDAEHSVLELGQDKLRRKGCDLLVVNQVGVGVTFGQDDNTVTILRQDGAAPVTVGPASKTRVSHALLDVIAAEVRR